MGLCPLPVPQDLPPSLAPLLTLSVLCPQASAAAGEGASGTGIVCGAPAPSSPLNQLSLFFSHASLLFLPSYWFLFAVFSSVGSCFGLTQAVCFAEQGAPQLVSALLAHPPLWLSAWEKPLPLCPALLVAGLEWPSFWKLRVYSPVGHRDKIGCHQWLAIP